MGRASVTGSAGSGEGEAHADRRRADHLWNAGTPPAPLTGRCPAYLKDDALKEMTRAGRCRPAHPHHAVGSERKRAGHRGRAPAPRSARILGNSRSTSPRVVPWWIRGGNAGDARLPLHVPAPTTRLSGRRTGPLTGSGRAERAAWPIALDGGELPPKVGEVAQRHPNLKLILDHLGRPLRRDEPNERWANLQEVLALRSTPTSR